MTPVNASFFNELLRPFGAAKRRIRRCIYTEELYTSLRYKVACSYVTNKVEAIFSDEIP